ncbi:MAG: EAL domain-containing protein [Rickettsiaceae bacterium]|nr:EAL domain-containing protein [Rickettsiaceae bacterium]MDP5021151.1 EAL domain-containing protein [Rickettsiaceae bacterium]MDP5083404.1 EAL domain-containing protein [Rickettsiaceae bacterium]
MARKAIIMANLQQEMDRIKTGILLSVKLLNQDELSILISDTSAIMDKFYSMVHTACTKSGDYRVVRTADPTNIYIILPDDVRVASRLAYSIYSQVQLYIDDEFPESYLKCSVGSIKFSPEVNLKADKLLSLLVYGILSSQDCSYYYSHDDNPTDIEALRARNIKLNLLRVSLLKGKAKFVYQPIVDRKSGNIEYYECLLRVPDEKNNLISVGPMIEDAEKKGLINIVDFTVIEMAIKELERDKKIKLSVNISNVGVLNHRLLKRIESLLKKYNVAKRLIIEITETSLNYDFNTTKRFIDTLHAYGCKFALDDFGSGFTSFKQLLNLPIDIIKIDGSYIRDILSNNHSRFFVEALIGLAGDLGIKTVAEFVENGEIARILIDIKIDGMQGNFFLPASENRVH